MDEQMFCYQCEQAAHGVGCTGRAGVCGKSAETADAQDRLTGALIGFATLLLDIGKPIQPPQALLLLEGLFTTITNVNFDPETVAQLTDKVWKAKQEAFASACPAPSPVGDYDMEKLWQEPDPDVKSLKSFVLFGLRGMAAYSYHARVLGYTDGEIDLFFCTALRALAEESDKDKLFKLVEDTGIMAYRVMAELDKANTGAFGDPEPVEVPLTIEKGPFIVISGHDLYDAKCLLEQTEGKGINVYTHSEMLPAHGYPELKKRFPHLKGNFGTAWQNQQREFEDIPAPILFTTNCIMPLRASYADRVFTTSVVAYPGVPHIDEGRDFSPVIEKALELGIELPQDVVDYIAENITNNVRQIEGTVKKIKAYHDLTGMPLDITNVSRAIKDMYKGKTQAIPTPDLIISEVCRFYSIDESTLRSTLKNKGTAEARQVAMYLIRKLTNLSLPDIAKEFGKNHTTVLYALKKVEQELPNSSNGLQDNIRDITSNINSRL